MADARGLRIRSRLLLALLAALPLSQRIVHAEGAALPPAELRAIEALIDSVTRLGDATFLRNGESYSATKAASFLRQKWQAHRDEVRSADDFIARIASASSTTGEPYRIRFADGRELSSADYLRAELARVRATTP